MRFAIVDTDRTLCRLMTAALRGAYPRADVLHFEDGRTALQALKSQPIDAMVCALVLPELDGLGLLEAMRTMKTRPHVMVVTQVTNERILARTLRLGAEYYMIKPVEPSLVCRRVGELLDGRTAAELPRVRARDCAQMLSELGVPARFGGYHYLLYGVELARRHPQYLNHVTTRLYPLIAERFGKRPASIERGIRYAIDMVFSSHTPFELSSCLCVDPSQLSERLTNRAFLALLANASLPD